MPKRCVAGGCSNTTEGGYSLHTFPKDPALRAQWTKEVARYCGGWPGPTEHSVLCSLHFTKDCYEASSLLTEEMALPYSQKRRLKSKALPTLFPRASDSTTGSMDWAKASIHFIREEVRPAVAKRHRTQVRSFI